MRMDKPKIRITTIVFLPTLLTLVLVINFLAVSVYAKDCGKLGQVYPIKEMDIVEFIRSRLKQMQISGELDKINKQMVEVAKARIARPTPAPDISSTKTYRQWYIDPTITFDHDIKDAAGNYIVKAGTTVNPFKSILLKKAYLFYDADNKAQVVWAIKQDKLLRGQDKLILVNGSIVEQIKLLKKRIYFDQHGRLVSKFKIRHTPAIVTQEGLQFKVEELVP